MVSRREFIQALIRLTPVWGGSLALLTAANLWHRDPLQPSYAWASKETKGQALEAPVARYWITPEQAGGDCLICHGGQAPPAVRGYKHRAGLVQCLLCAQGCVLVPGQRGRCRVRVNRDGQLRSLVYGRPVAIHTDPIEKKPFYHFLPAASAFSLGTTGCPLSCRFCQNWEISQASPEDIPVAFASPSVIVDAARRRKAPVLAFTYNEPTVFYEYMIDIARLARLQGLRTAMISCGIMNPAPLVELCRHLDAVKIDLKGFSKSFYRDVCGADLDPVLKAIRTASRSGVHLEIVNLVVPTLNDTDAMIQGLCRWVTGEIGPDVPVHFTRFHPNFQILNLPPTPVATLERARNTALDMGIHYAYVGNVPGHPGNHTYCPSCKKMVIRRQGFFVGEVHLRKGHCAFCGHKIDGVWT